MVNGVSNDFKGAAHHFKLAADEGSGVGQSAYRDFVWRTGATHEFHTCPFSIPSSHLAITPS
jgi:hypothetical protein